MRSDKLKSGTLVTLNQTRLDGAIYARRVPEAIKGPRSAKNPTTMANAAEAERVIITTIPNGAQVLYMSTQEDAFNSALRANGTGPYGYTPAHLYYHFVLWNDRPVWVSSADAELRPVAPPTQTG